MYTLDREGKHAVHIDGDPVDVYALRGRDEGVEVEATDLPNVRGHTGKDGGGHDQFVHDRRPAVPCVDQDIAPTLKGRQSGGGWSGADVEQAFVVEGQAEAETFEPRAYTRDNKTGGALGDEVGALTSDVKRGDSEPHVLVEGQAEAFLTRAYTRDKDGELADTSPSLTKEADRGDGHPMVLDRRDPACINPDAFGRDGLAKTDSPDAEGIMRKRDAGLGVIDDGTTYSLKTGAPPAVGPVPVQDGRDIDKQQNGLGVGEPGDPAYTLDTTGAQAVGPVEKPVGFTSTLGSLDADGIEEDASPPVMARTPPAACIPEEPFAFESRVARNGRGAPSDTVNALKAEAGSTGRGDAAPMVALSPQDSALAELLEARGYLPAVPFDPKPDGPRYAAMGDAVTVNVIHWIAEGVRAEADAHGGLYEVPA